jgi:peptide deformylase
LARLVLSGHAEEIRMPKLEPKPQPASAAPTLVPTPAQAFASGTFRRVPFRRVLMRPDPILSRRAREIDPRAPGVIDLAETLVTTMRASPSCLGIAAPQIGESVRMFCIDVAKHKKTQSCAGLIVMVNPRIVQKSGDVMMREGCLSVPDFTGDVWRAERVVVEGFMPGSTKLLRIVADGMEARCLQHEIDHLDGLVFVERVRDASALHPRKTFA